MTTRRGASALALLVTLWLLAWAGGASADSRTQFLISRLRADDFRVRTNAALALGASNDDAAAQPLCGALNDSSNVVRQAAAVALKRLNRSSTIACLKARLQVEPSNAVKLQITRALETITPPSNGGGGGGGPPAHVANARYYVAVSTVTNHTGRSQADVERIVGSAVRTKLDGLGGYQVAPTHESPSVANAVLKKRNLKGFYLAVSADKFDYSGGNLRVQVRVTVFSYPGRDLRGEIPVHLTQLGVRPGDHGAEDNLMQMAAAHAVELFAQNFQ